MIFKDERELKLSIRDKLVAKFDEKFTKENLMTTRLETIEQTIDEVFSQLRTKDMLK